MASGAMLAGSNPHDGANAAAAGGSRHDLSCFGSHHLPPTGMSLVWEGPKCHPQLEQELLPRLPCQPGRSVEGN